jgi:hypothetical protein
MIASSGLESRRTKRAKRILDSSDEEEEEDTMGTSVAAANIPNTSVDALNLSTGSSSSEQAFSTGWLDMESESSESD